MTQRIRPLALLAITLVALGGCGGGGGSETTPDAGTGDAGMIQPDAGKPDGGTMMPRPDGGVACDDVSVCGSCGSSLCCPSTAQCVAPPAATDPMSGSVDTLCDTGKTCPAANVAYDPCMCTDADDGFYCTQCVTKPALATGHLAEFLSMARGDDGTLYFAGYAPGDPATGPTQDLVFGTWNTASSSVTWQLVDGVPTDAPVVGDPSGWRGGIAAPGDDVGQYASIAVHDGTIHIAYYDATNGALKYARGDGAGPWAVQTVSDTEDSGKFAALSLLADGTPVIAFQRVAAPAPEVKLPTASVVVATASSPTPSGPADWTETVVATTPVACRPGLCGDDRLCNLNTFGCESPSDACDPACVSGLGGTQVCVTAPGGGGQCTGVTYTEARPPFIGLSNQLVALGEGKLALAYYDRQNGHVVGVRFDGAAWGEPFIIDGVGQPSGAGDSGIDVSLAVDDAGGWHLSYLDGSNETLRYAYVAPDAATATSVALDDGRRAGFDQRSFVGVDSAIAVTPTGTVRIVYQDSTRRTLLVTECTAGSCADDAASWSAPDTLDGMGSTGFFNNQSLDGETSVVGTWWILPDEMNGVHVLRFP